MSRCVDLLLRRGPMSALSVARELGIKSDEAYAELVHAEARGDVEIRCMDRDNQSATRLWAATFRAVSDAAADKRFAAWLAAATPAQVEAWKRRNGGRIELAEPTDDQLPEPLRGGALVVF